MAGQLKPLLGILGGLAIGALVTLIAHWHNADSLVETHVPHPAGPMLAVTFGHADHSKQNCIVCHHNFVDDTGQGMCFDCHKNDPQVAHLIEDQFHDLCRSCHQEKQADGQDHGPIRQCRSCHQPDQAP